MLVQCSRPAAVAQLVSYLIWISTVTSIEAFAGVVMKIVDLVQDPSALSQHWRRTTYLLVALSTYL